MHPSVLGGVVILALAAIGRTVAPAHDGSFARCGVEKVGDLVELVREDATSLRDLHAPAGRSLGVTMKITSARRLVGDLHAVPAP